MTHVPYKGVGPALNDLLGEHVDFFFSGFPAAVAQVKAGKLKLLACRPLSARQRRPMCRRSDSQIRQALIQTAQPASGLRPISAVCCSTAPSVWTSLTCPAALNSRHSRLAVKLPLHP